MAKFNDSEKAKIFKAKRPVIHKMKRSFNKLYPILTVVNTVVIMYILINKLF